jgi:hypothetical protein
MWLYLVRMLPVSNHQSRLSETRPLFWRVPLTRASKEDEERDGKGGRLNKVCAVISPPTPNGWLTPYERACAMTRRLGGEGTRTEVWFAPAPPPSFPLALGASQCLPPVVAGPFFSLSDCFFNFSPPSPPPASALVVNQSKSPLLFCLPSVRFLFFSCCS